MLLSLKLDLKKVRHLSGHFILTIRILDRKAKKTL